MSKIQLLAFVLPAFAGCLGSAPQAPVNWTLTPAVAAVERVKAPKYGMVRLAQVAVRSPYDGSRLAVLRPGGSLAFDAFNVFAAPPASILKGVACDLASETGLFARVLPGTSSAAAELSLEVTVRELALDCRKAESRNAAVSVSLLLLRGREIVSAAEGAGTAATGDGDYTSAFSSAFASAFAGALKKL